MNDDFFMFHDVPSELIQELFRICRAVKSRSDEDGDPGPGISSANLFQE